MPKELQLSPEEEKNYLLLIAALLETSTFLEKKEGDENNANLIEKYQAILEKQQISLEDLSLYITDRLSDDEDNNVFVQHIRNLLPQEFEEFDIEKIREFNDMIQPDPEEDNELDIDSELEDEEVNYILETPEMKKEKEETYLTLIAEFFHILNQENIQDQDKTQFIEQYHDGCKAQGVSFTELQEYMKNFLMREDEKIFINKIISRINTLHPESYKEESPFINMDHIKDLQQNLSTYSREKNEEDLSYAEPTDRYKSSPKAEEENKQEENAEQIREREMLQFLSEFCALEKEDDIDFQSHFISYCKQKEKDSASILNYMESLDNKAISHTLAINIYRNIDPSLQDKENKLRDITAALFELKNLNAHDIAPKPTAQQESKERTSKDFEKLEYENAQLKREIFDLKREQQKLLARDSLKYVISNTDKQMRDKQNEMETLQLSLDASKRKADTLFSENITSKEQIKTLSERLNKLSKEKESSEKEAEGKIEEVRAVIVERDNLKREKEKLIGEHKEETSVLGQQLSVARDAQARFEEKQAEMEQFLAKTQAEQQEELARLREQKESAPSLAQDMLGSFQEAEEAAEKAKAAQAAAEAELATLREQMEKDAQAAKDQLAAVEAEKQATVEAKIAAHTAELEQIKSTHSTALVEQKASLQKEQEEESRLEKEDHQKEIARLQEINTTLTQTHTTIAEAEARHAQKLAELQQSHKEATDKLQANHATALANAEKQATATLDNEKLRQELTTMEASHEKALAQQRHAHEEEMKSTKLFQQKNDEKAKKDLEKAKSETTQIRELLTAARKENSTLREKRPKELEEQRQQQEEAHKAQRAELQRTAATATRNAEEAKREAGELRKKLHETKTLQTQLSAEEERHAEALAKQQADNDKKLAEARKEAEAKEAQYNEKLENQKRQYEEKLKAAEMQRQNEVEALKAENVQLTTNLTQARIELAQTTERIKQLTDQLTTQNAELNRLRPENENLRTECDRLGSTLHSTQTQLSEANQTIQQLAQKVHANEIELRKLRKAEMYSLWTSRRTRNTYNEFITYQERLVILAAAKAEHDSGGSAWEKSPEQLKHPEPSKELAIFFHRPPHRHSTVKLTFYKTPSGVQIKYEPTGSRHASELANHIRLHMQDPAITNKIFQRGFLEMEKSLITPKTPQSASELSDNNPPSLPPSRRASKSSSSSSSSSA